MNKVDKIRKELSQKVLCCFTCYHGVGGAGGKFECDKVEAKPVPVSRESLCGDWVPDMSEYSQAEWDLLMEAREEHMMKHPSPKE